MRVTGTTRTLALLGHPVAGSRSPELHNAWMRQHGFDAVYVALDVPAERARACVPALRALGLHGVNLTVPLKERVLDQLDALEPAAREAGAVNTIYRDGDRLVGANTDGEGLLRALADRGLDPTGARVAIVGAGGAARGIAAALTRVGLDELRILNRTPARARAVAQAFGGIAAPLDADLDGVELVIVCTSAPVPLGLPAGATLVDIGTRTPEGLAMLCWQGALAFERWTGIRPDAREALGRMLAAPPLPPDRHS
jgi:shikimate dehydrogenase